MKKYGAHLGNAFQLVDDYLDYAGDAATMGKNQGDDLAEGKVTLPLIEAMRSGSPAQAAIIRDAINHRSAEQMPEVLAIVQGTGALGYTRQRAEQEADQARACLAALPHSAYRDSLDHLCQMAVKRNS
jgi:octaprenyl-diphosphate synthase